MKVLIAYDGSEHAQAALDDLRRAGIPADTEVLVVSVTDTLLPFSPPPPEEAAEQIIKATASRRVTSALVQAHAQAAQAMQAAQDLAEEAAHQLRFAFPRWQVSAEGLTGTPTWEIIQRAENWGADLVVVGSQGRTALGRLLLGSVSQKVTTEARCSVRVVHRAERERKDNAPVRLIVGVDGSAAAQVAVHAVAARVWPAGSEAFVINADSHVRPTGLARILPTASSMMTENIEEEVTLARAMMDAAVAELRERAGLQATAEVVVGDPQTVLLAEAEKRAVDCIFVGSRLFSGALERFRLGSVSTALVTNANCTVEVARAAEEFQEEAEPPAAEG